MPVAWLLAWSAVGACGSDSAAGPDTAGTTAVAGMGGSAGEGAMAGSGAAGRATAAGSGGKTAGTGAAGSAGTRVPAAGGGAGSAGAGTGAAAGAPSAGSGGSPSVQKFSFFVTSVAAMRELSNSSMGFGGDLRFGKATGLEGADEICRQIAEKAVPGSGSKGWRAFLSATSGGPNGGPVHAKDRVGDGPWYDRLERLVAANKADLLQPRPQGAHPAIINDLPNEDGIPNHMDGAPGCTSDCPDNHQVLTGTNAMGMLYSSDPESTCNDWTNSMPTGKPWCGHSWPRQVSGINWMSSAADGGCAPCVELVEMGGVRAPCVGSAGGYGGIYCFALSP